MTITKAANELIKRGIVKPTPVRGRYRFTELGLSLYTSIAEYLSYSRNEVLAVTTTNDGKEYTLNQEVKDQRVITEFKSVTIARKLGYTARHSTITKLGRKRNSPTTTRASTTRKAKFMGWSYELNAFNLTPAVKIKLEEAVEEVKEDKEGVQDTLSLSLNVVDRKSEEALHSVLAVKLNKTASIDIQVKPIYESDKD